MKKTLNLIALIFLIIQPNVHSQGILDKLNQSIDDAIDELGDKAVERVIERMFEKALSGESTESESDSLAIIESSDSDTTETSTIDIGSLFGGGGKLEGVYEFDYHITYDIITDENKSKMDMYIRENAYYMMAEMSSAQVVMDFKKEKAYTLMNDKAYSFGLKSMKEKFSEPYSNDPDATIEVTDEYQIIAGYKTRLYKITTEDGVTDLWITKDFVNFYFLMEGQLEEQLKPLEGGFALKIEFFDKDGSHLIQEVTAIEKTDRVIDLSQY